MQRWTDSFGVTGPRAWRVAVAAFALSLGATPAARAELPCGAVYVTTLPEGAEVWVDGVYAGRSPVYVGTLTTGRHALTLTKSGWNVREASVDIATRATTMESIALEAAPQAMSETGSVLVRGVAQDVKVQIDGRDIDPAAPQTLPAGLHRIVLGGAHGARTSFSFTVVPETSSVLVARAPAQSVPRSGVVALADNYVPRAYTIESGKIVLRYDGHVVIGHVHERTIRFDGTPISYDSAPETIGGKLYLPLELLERLTGGPGDVTAPAALATATPQPTASQ